MIRLRIISDRIYLEYLSFSNLIMITSLEWQLLLSDFYALQGFIFLED